MKGLSSDRKHKDLLWLSFCIGILLAFSEEGYSAQDPQNTDCPPEDENCLDDDTPDENIEGGDLLLLLFFAGFGGLFVNKSLSGGGDFTSESAAALPVEIPQTPPSFLLKTDAATVTEDVLPTSAFSTIPFIDPNTNDTYTLTVSSLVANIGDFGASFGVGDTGQVDWQYTVDNADIQFLSGGQTQDEIFQVIIDDGNGGSDTLTVTITLTGANDAIAVDEPNSDTTGAVTEEDAAILMDSGTIEFLDPDLADVHTITQISASSTAGGVLGKMSLEGVIPAGDLNTVWIYTVDNTLPQIQALGEGETIQETFTLRISDPFALNDTVNVVVTINGKNDPVGAVTDNDANPNAVSEIATNGTLVGVTALAMDPDTNDIVTYTLLDDAGGAFQIDPNTGVVTVADASKIDYDENLGGSQALTIQVQASDGATNSSETFSITVIDEPKIVVLESDGDTTIGENGLTDSITIIFTEQPTEFILFELSPEDNSLFFPDPTFFFVDSTTWTTPITITLMPVDNDVAQGNQTTQLNYSVSSLDTDFDNFALTSTLVNFLDDDTAGVVVSKASVSVEEGDATSQFSVVLNSEPTATVSIVFSSAAGQVTFSVPLVNFTSSNWSTPVPITVTAIDDNVVEGVHTDSISLSVSSVDTTYNNFPVSDLTVTIQDNDTATITIQNILVDESDGTVMMMATLDKAVVGGVSADVILIDGTAAVLTDYTAIDTNVVFSGFANETQIISINIQDDFVEEPTEFFTVQLSNSSDPNVIATDTATVTINDNDMPGILFTFSGGNNTLYENSGTDTIAVTLSTQPLNDVTITLTSNDLTEFMPNTASLTFTTTNWNDAQTITLIGQDDLVVDGAQLTSLHYETDSLDAVYDLFSGNLPVLVLDNESTLLAAVYIETDLGGGYSVGIDPFIVLIADLDSNNIANSGDQIIYGQLPSTLGSGLPATQSADNLVIDTLSTIVDTGNDFIITTVFYDILLSDNSATSEYFNIAFLNADSIQLTDSSTNTTDELIFDTDANALPWSPQIITAANNAQDNSPGNGDTNNFFLDIFIGFTLP